MAYSQDIKRQARHHARYLDEADFALKTNSADDTVVEPTQRDDPFAYAPGQMDKLINPKSLRAFHAIGGSAVLEKGLRVDRNATLSVDDESTHTPEKALHVNRNTSLCVKDKSTHTFEANELLERKSKSISELMWIAYNDKILILLTAATVIALGLSIYEGGPIDYESIAVIISIIVVVLFCVIDDQQKGEQFELGDKRFRRRLDSTEDVISALSTREKRKTSEMRVPAFKREILEDGHNTVVVGRLSKKFAKESPDMDIAASAANQQSFDATLLDHPELDKASNSSETVCGILSSLHLVPNSGHPGESPSSIQYSRGKAVVKSDHHADIRRQSTDARGMDMFGPEHHQEASDGDRKRQAAEDFEGCIAGTRYKPGTKNSNHGPEVLFRTRMTWIVAGIPGAISRLWSGWKVFWGWTSTDTGTFTSTLRTIGSASETTISFAAKFASTGNRFVEMNGTSHRHYQSRGRRLGVSIPRGLMTFTCMIRMSMALPVSPRPDEAELVAGGIALAMGYLMPTLPYAAGGLGALAFVSTWYQNTKTPSISPLREMTFTLGSCFFILDMVAPEEKYLNSMVLVLWMGMQSNYMLRNCRLLGCPTLFFWLTMGSVSTILFPSAAIFGGTSDVNRSWGARMLVVLPAFAPLSTLLSIFSAWIAWKYDQFKRADQGSMPSREQEDTLMAYRSVQTQSLPYEGFVNQRLRVQS